MKTNDDQEEKKTDINILLTNRLIIFLHIAFYTVTTLAVLGGGGYLLDQYIKTFPIFFISGLVISYPLVQIVLFKKLKKLINKKTSQANGKHS